MVTMMYYVNLILAPVTTDGLNNYLSSVNWDELFTNVVDINDCFVSFTTVLIDMPWTSLHLLN